MGNHYVEDAIVSAGSALALIGYVLESSGNSRVEVLAGTGEHGTATRARQ
jgi:hypothetical protein